MARLERPQTKSSNPATKFIQWKSEEKCFSYYSKEQEKNIKIVLPFKFLFLEHYHCVKGWHDATQKGIISNEVYGISNEILNIRTYGGIELISGLYKDIKDRTKLIGGVYHRSIYVMLEDGSMANIQLKGATVGGLLKDNSLDKIDIDGYSEFYKKNNHLLDNQFIEVKSFADAKKGTTKYSIPIFEAGGHVTKKQNEQADICAKKLEAYIKNDVLIEKAIEEEGEDLNNDLPF